MEMRMPRITPGKNPARTAPAGNLLQDATGRGEVVFCDGAFEMVGMMVGCGVVLALVPVLVLVGFGVEVEEGIELVEEVAGGFD
jgi:hypothetical protein